MPLYLSDGGWNGAHSVFREGTLAPGRKAMRAGLKQQMKAEHTLSPYRKVVVTDKREALRRRLVALVFVIYWLLILEGALRKWVLPDYEQYLFFIKVPFVLILYWMAFQHRRWPRTIAPMAAYYLLVFVVTMLVPIQLLVGEYSSPHLLLAVYGWINYFFYIPLAFLIFEQFEREDLGRLFKHTVWLAVLAVPIVILQFYSPSGSVINIGSGVSGVNQFEGLGSALGYIRPMGFFTSPLAQQQFVAATAAIVVATLLQRSRERLLSNRLLWTGVIAVVTMSIFSQSRGLLLSVGLVLVVAVTAGLLTGKRQTIVNAAVWPVALVAAVAVLWPLLLPTSFEVFSARWTGAWQVETDDFQYGIFGRALWGLYSFVFYLPDTPFFGYLLGLAGNASSQLQWVQMPQAAYEWTGSTAWAEQGLSRHIVELGPVLGIVFITFRVWLTAWVGLRALRATRYGRDPLPLVLFGYVGIVLLYGQITGNVTVNGYAWMFLGLCLAAARNVERNRREERT